MTDTVKEIMAKGIARTAGWMAPPAPGMIRDAQASIDALTQAGYQIVPVEPTEKMQEAVLCIWKVGRTTNGINLKTDSTQIYQAMLKASKEAIE